jgi:hypothetical protein
MLQTKLTPNLASFVSVIESELQHGLEMEVPQDLQDWKTVQVYELLLRIVARISARVFIGEPHCRNEEWLDTSIKYTENLFTTVMLLRRLPGLTPSSPTACPVTGELMPISQPQRELSFPLSTNAELRKPRMTPTTSSLWTCSNG